MKYIYGLNKSGLSIIKYFKKNNIPFAVWDDDKKRREELKSIVSNLIFIAPKNLNFFQFKELYITPGIDFKQKKLNIIKKNRIKMFRDLELYSNLLKKQKVIAITGTNGKSTTTKLIGNLIEQKYKNCFVGGNIGKPLIDSFNSKYNSKFHVIELSSFQLESAPSFKSYISILLNISKDHQDRYKTFKDYVLQKKKIFNSNSSFNIISLDDKHCLNILKSYRYKFANFIGISSINQIKKGIYIYENSIIDDYFYNKKVIPINKISNSLRGNFNLQNILATYAVSKILNINQKLFNKCIEKFKGLPHRMEKIYENKRILIINNSKATNLDSAINSIKHFQNIYLIFGGKIKNKNFLPLTKYKKNIEKCYIIGNYSKFIYKQINKIVNSKLSYNLDDAIKHIILDLKSNKNKKTILFSPGCSSFDQFTSFEERGNCFRKLILNYKKKLNE